MILLLCEILVQSLIATVEGIAFKGGKQTQKAELCRDSFLGRDHHFC